MVKEIITAIALGTLILSFWGVVIYIIQHFLFKYW